MGRAEQFCHGKNRCCGKDDPAGIRQTPREAHVLQEGTYAELILSTLLSEGNKTGFL